MAKLNSGAIDNRGKNKWRVRLSIGIDDLTGKRKYYTQTITGTKAQARKHLNQALRNRDMGLLADNKKTLSAYIDEWLPSKKLRIAERTYKGYLGIIERDILPYLAKKPLIDITTTDLSKILIRYINKGKTTSAFNIYRIMTLIFGSAIKRGEIYKDPTNALDSPKIIKKERKILTPEQWQDALRYIDDNMPEHKLMFTLFITTGMRRSEVSGLRWSDINLREKNLRVNRSIYQANGKLYETMPKTQRSNRIIVLDHKTNSLLAMHKTEMDIRYKKYLERPVKDDDFVFSHTLGTPFRPDSITQAWGKVKKALGFDVGVHDLRHTSASLMLANGVPVGDVSDRLGHANPGFTLSVYRHAVPGSQEKAVEKLIDALENKLDNSNVSKMVSKKEIEVKSEEISLSSD